MRAGQETVGGVALIAAATHLSLRSPFSMTLSAAGGAMFLGLPLWCLATGPTLLVRTRRARPSLGDVAVS